MRKQGNVKKKKKMILDIKKKKQRKDLETNGVIKR